jgi:peptidoglycan/xylan/chitin deacetylase (PgdA/CDA1 family)
MLWNRVRMAIACTSGLVLFSSNAGKQEEQLTKIAESLKPRSAAYTIFLTFDDGPSNSSSFINKLSQKDSLPVNVFLIGRNVYLRRTNRQLLNDYRSNEWVEIGNHSYTHAERHYTKFFREPSKVLADFNRTRDSLHLTNGLVRLPGRNCFRVDSLSRNDGNGSAAADTLAANGYHVFGWDIEWCNKPKKGIGLHTGQEMLDIVDGMLDRKTTFLPRRLVILLHDNELNDPGFREELQQFILLARADGKYRFEHLSEYSHDGN